jgi:hypothetical protein
MRGVMLLVLSALVLTAAPAFANGISLRWTNCVAEGGTRNMAFACDTNSGSRAIVTSFVLAFPVVGSRSVSATLDVVAAGVTLPAWWDFKACRNGSMLFQSTAVGPVSCDLAQGFFGGGSINSYLLGVNGPNTARLQCVTSSTGHDLVAGHEYIGPVLSMNFSRTLGTPCGGCDIGVCLVLRQLTIGTTPGGPELMLTEPELPPDGNIATWQAVGLTPGGVCQAATPTRLAVWGAVKALYR